VALPTALPRKRRPDLRSLAASLRAWALSPAGGAALLTIAFIGITVWWVSEDSRVPDFDNGKHLLHAFSFYEEFRKGAELHWFKTYTQYPPLVHLVGAMAGFLRGGFGVETPTVLANVVFVPMLTAGCYLAGARAYGRVAGLLAVVFALGTPMVISQFHVFMLDVPETAMVAASVGLLLASNRFENVWVSALAGSAVGAGMLTKGTFAIFVAGVIAMVFLRGGWRNWRGLIAFAAVALAIALPWYVEHYPDLRGQTTGATARPSGEPLSGGAPGNIMPLRWSDENALWYVWNLDAHQLRLPLILFVLVGVIFACARLIRRRRDDSQVADLLVGGLVSYLGITFLTSFHDPRYSLPWLVYLAVLGSGWITQVRRSVAVPAVVALAVVAALNTAGVTFGFGKAVEISLAVAPDNPIGDKKLTLFSPNGYVVGEPVDGPVPHIMQAVKQDGYRRIHIDPGAQHLFFNFAGLDIVSRENGLIVTYGEPTRLGRRTVFMARRLMAPGDPEPCARLSDMGDDHVLYLTVGKPRAPEVSRWKLYCPIRESG
jgi:Dolichyl-phosphate-mannose-protein mannosyltransferase